MNTEKKISALDVIKRMVDDNNPGCRLASLANVDKVEIKGKNGYFTIGTPTEDVRNWMRGKTRHGGLFLIDGEAFRATEEKMKLETEYPPNP